ncbi:hypothetical protein EJD88_21640 [Pseudomonas sp. PB105]|uniref:hypothetical protein n=1 Tax=unclassified Pseudomonas TaxID=196821 RepID=UPI00131C9AA1|nr:MULTISPECIES: hypothetical protein [unclassified Pseudomonas]KAE9650742.1 hypothetical protein EJD88_21640 [Pseudomonas sp. PB105]MVW94815.1 hypothetical protein [Pseudomonas sp. PB100]
MPKTAYSIRYGMELDANQLVSLYTGQSIEASDEILKDIPPSIRTLVGVDVLCSSCGVSGAIIVSGAHSKSSKAQIRLAHFRFKGDDEEDTHREFCEFSNTDDDTPKLGGDVKFEKPRTNEQRAIRSLVCKAIELKVFSQADMRSMRQWYFDTKTADCYQMEITEKPFIYLNQLFRTVGWGAGEEYRHHPSYGEIPGYDWNYAAFARLTQKNKVVRDALRGMGGTGSISEALRLVSKFQGRKIFNVTALEPYYKKTIELCAFASRHVIKKSKIQRYASASNELLAFCSLLLSTSSWSVESAIDSLVKIARAPEPTDLLLGNIIGLNPFHEYDAWRLIKVVSEIQGDFDFSETVLQQVANIKSSMKAEYIEWRKNEGLPDIAALPRLGRVPLPSPPWGNEDDLPF